MLLLHVLGGEVERFVWERRYLLQNMDWFEEEVGEYEDDYLIIDCPGMPRVFAFPPDFFFCHAVARLAPTVTLTDGLTPPCRPDRALYTPPVPSHPREKPATARYAYLCSLPP